jgi:hypothetical protein
MRVIVALALAVLSIAPLAAADSRQPLVDGTLLFLENCNSVVEWTTHGKMAHVAMLMHDGGTAYVYEATPGKVRRVSLDDYYAELAQLNRRRDDDEQIRVHALRPEPEYSADEAAKMRAFLDAQLGRRYSVKNYVRGKPYDGIHCAELTSSTLNQSGRYDFRDCHTIHPQALYSLVLESHASPQVVAIPKPAERESWLVRWQRCCLGWFVWCRWSSREAWLFFW